MVHSDRVSRRTPLGVAARKGDVRLVRNLHESGASLDAGGCAPILDACVYGRKEVLEYLLEHGADMNAVSHTRLPAPGTYSINCIMVAVASLSLPVLRMVLSHARGKVDINAVCEHTGFCALGLAVTAESEDLVRAIIGAGADASVFLRHRAFIEGVKDDPLVGLIEEARASHIRGLIGDHHRRDLLWCARRKRDAVHAISNRTHTTITNGNAIDIGAVREQHVTIASLNWLECRVSRAQALPEVTVRVCESKQTLSDANAFNRRKLKRPAEATARASPDNEGLSSAVGCAVVKHAIESLDLSLLLEVLGSYGRDNDPQASVPPSTSSDTVVAGFCGEGLPHDDGCAPNMYTRSRRCYLCQGCEDRDQVLVCSLCCLGMHKGCITKHSLALPSPSPDIPPEVVIFRVRQLRHGEALDMRLKVKYFQTAMGRVFKHFAERQGDSPGIYRFTYNGRVVTGNLTAADLGLDESSVIDVTRHPMLPPDDVLALAAGGEEGDDGEDDESSGDEEDDDGGDDDGCDEGEEGEAGDDSEVEM